MTRLLAAISAMGLLSVFGSTVLSDNRPLTGALLCLAGYAAFTGALANPAGAAVVTTGMVGFALLISGRLMEGVGLILLLGLAGLRNRATEPERPQAH